ncbi:MAG: hypothetical protein H0X24_04005 [Ktedonobacterales bacterium]|nr:hypothetical protein [Ktedonobacterales bacterium]
MPDYFTYLAEFTAYKRHVFREVLAPIGGGDVLDLGCGPVGHYWALGYITRAASLTYADRSPTYLADLAAQIDACTPAWLLEQFALPLAFLAAERGVPMAALAQDLAAAFAEKPMRSLPCDFTTDDLGGPYDAILSVEGISCAHDGAHLVAIAQRMRAALRPDGACLGVWLRFGHRDAYVQSLIAQGLESAYNPSPEEMREAFAAAGFADITVTTATFPENGNYAEAVCYHVR